MKKLKVGINGFGRIGRVTTRLLWDNPNLELVAINDLTPLDQNAHLLKYDSVHGVLDRNVRADKDGLTVGSAKVRVTAERDPAKLPWKQLGVDLVLECSGLFTDRDKAAKHLEAGAKKVIISAPAKGADITICKGVNDGAYDAAKHAVISNA